MNPDEMEHLLTEHRLDGPGADLRARTLARAEAAWRNGDGHTLGLELWGFVRRWGLGVAAALVLNLTVDGLGRGGGSLVPASTSVTVSTEWQELCRDLELPEALRPWLRSVPAATTTRADGRLERRQLERELGRAG